MKKMPSFSLDYYNKNVIERIIEKYGYEQMAAARAFLGSETHRMLEDANLGMWDFGANAIFEMWECEKITGDPRNSIYIRGE